MTTTPSWCILQTSGPSTLSVVSSLLDAGFEAWTPTERKPVKVGRQRKIVTRSFPLIPWLVFARGDRIDDLAAFARTPAQTFIVWDAQERRMVQKGCPHFSLMKHCGRHVSVSDRELDALRAAEQREAPLSELKLFTKGEKVLYPGAGFDGLVGIVQTTKGRNALVCFEGFAIPVTVGLQGLLSAA